MTKQETFDVVIAHARHQRMPSVGANGDCAYRGPNGLQCFLGPLIPDALYSRDMEGKDATEISQLLADLKLDVSLCSDLQLVHDVYDEKNWESELQFVANVHNLIYTPPEMACPVFVIPARVEMDHLITA